MKKLTLEYIAGFVDGEGTFSIRKHPKDSYYPEFSISNSNLQVLKDIRQYFSLTTKIRSQRPKKPNHKIYYELSASSIDDCKSIATLLEPHLRIKKEHAQILMQYPRSYRIPTVGKYLPDFSTMAYILKLRKRIFLLNKKGRPTQGANEDLQADPDPQLNLLDLNRKEVI